MFSLPTSLPLLKVPSVSTTIASGARLVFEYGGGGGGGDMRLGIKAHENVNLAIKFLRVIQAYPPP